MVTKKIKNTLVALSLALLLFPSTVFGAITELQAFAIDTVAGNPTIIKSSKGLANVKVNFSIEKPDQTVLTLPTLSNDEGIAKLELADYHTQMAGNYQVKAYYPGLNSIESPSSSFVVYPGEVNVEKSTVKVNAAIAKADGEDSAQVKVELLDNYNNTVNGHVIRLISNRSNDHIDFSSNVTDNQGNVTFYVSSDEAGTSYYTAIDSTEDVILDNRVAVSFRNELLANAGGDLIPIAYAQEAGPLAGFEIFDLDDPLELNDNVSFKVRAIDADDVTVQDYTGTIRFSATGDNYNNVELPLDFKFEAEDLGEHEFSQGLSFAESGTYSIVVTDTNDFLKTGELTITVDDSASSSGSSSGKSGSGSAAKPVIASPTEGTYSQKTITLNGNAGIGSTIRVYDNGLDIGETPVNSTGKFSFQTPSLNDGVHEIYVVQLDSITREVEATSDTIQINIDSQGPSVDELRIDPKSGISAGDVISVKIFSEANLSQAAIIFNSDIVELLANASDPTLYEGSVQAPATPGEYPIDIILVDELENELNLKDKAVVTVGPADTTIQIDDEETVETETEEVVEPTETEEPEVEEEEEDVEAPTQVIGLIAYGSDSKVTLVWDAATDDGEIMNYRIYYGTSIRNLNQIANTKDNSTTWYIPNLENGEEYFFAATAVDDEGNESEDRSEIVSGIPFVLEIDNELSEVVPQQPLPTPDDELNPAAYGVEPGRHSSTGPGLLFLIPGALASGFILIRKKR